jgi:hypothetical protein
MNFVKGTMVVFRLPAETRTNGDGLQVDPEMVFVQIGQQPAPTPTDLTICPVYPRPQAVAPAHGLIARFNAYRHRRHRGGKI